jgi:hypothetical protein
MEWINLLITFVLGGGLVALFTIKPQKRKAEAEADQTKANANSTEIQNYGQIAKEWREYALEAEKRYEAMTLLMQKQIASLTLDVDRVTDIMEQILIIVKEINHENLEEKKKQIQDVARS